MVEMPISTVKISNIKMMKPIMIPISSKATKDSCANFVYVDRDGFVCATMPDKKSPVVLILLYTITTCVKKNCFCHKCFSSLKKFLSILDN